MQRGPLVARTFVGHSESERKLVFSMFYLFFSVRELSRTEKTHKKVTPKLQASSKKKLITEACGSAGSDM